MNGRSLVVHPARRKPMHRKKTRRRPRRPPSGLSSFITMTIAAMFLGSLSFAAVAIDWPKLLNGGEAMSLAHAKAMALQLSGKSAGASESPEIIERKAATMAALGITNGRAKAKLAESDIHLEAPKGHCFLNPEHPGDARLYSVFQRVFRGDIRMLNGYADCLQLDMWRAGGRTTLDNYGNVLIPVAMLNRTVEGPSKPFVDVVCKTMRENAGEFRGRNMPGLKDRFEKALASSRINEMRLLGVVDQDDNACYFVLLQKIMTERREPKTQIDVTAVTFIAGKMVYINLYGELESDDTLSELLQRQKANVARNVALNRG